MIATRIGLTITLLTVFTAEARAEPVRRLSLRKNGATGAIAFDRESRILAAAGSDGTISLWFTDTGAELRTISASPRKTAINALVFAPDGNTLYAGDEDGSLTAWDAVTGARRLELAAHGESIRAVAITQFGDLVASAGWDGKVQLLETATGVITQTFQDTSPIHGLTFSPDGKYLGIAGPRNSLVRAGSTVKFLEIERNVLVRTLRRHDTGATAVVIAPANDVAAAAGEDGSVTLIATTYYELEESLRGHSGPVRSLSFRADGKLLASAGDDRIIRFWSVRARRERDRATAGGAVKAVRFSPHGKYLASADDAGNIILWNTTSLEGDLQLAGAEEKVAAAREFFVQQKLDDALREARAALALEPNNVAAHTIAGRVHLARSVIADAVSAFEAANRGDPEEPMSSLVLGILAREQNRPDDAARLFKRSMTRNPSNPEPYVMMAQMLLKRGDYGGAGRWNLAALDLAPNDSGLKYNLACGYAVGKQSKRSLDWLEAAFRSDYHGFDWVDQDPELENIRGSERYRQLMLQYGKSSDFFGSGGNSARADELEKQADAARNADDWATAADLYQKAITEERATPKPRLAELRIMMLWLGGALENLGEEERSLATFQESAALGRQLYIDDNVTRYTVTLMAKLHGRLGQGLKAQTLYEEAIAAHRKHGEKEMVAKNLSRLAGVLMELGRFDQAQEKLEEAISLARELPAEPQLLADALEERTSLYKKSGQQKKALESAKETLAIVRKLSDKRELSSQLSNLGDLLAESGDTAGAIELFKESITVAEQHGNPRVVALAMEHLARFYAQRGRFEDASALGRQAVEKARQSGRHTSLLAALSATAWIEGRAGQLENSAKLYAEALGIARKIGREGGIASLTALSGDAERRVKRYDAALRLMEEALALRRKLGELPAVAETLSKIAHIRFEQDQFDEASKRLSEAVQIYEQLRLRAKGEARREYLSSQIFTYRFLILTQLKADKTFDAYRTLELSRAKMLAEKLAIEESEATIPTIPELQSLAGEGAILTFGNSDWGAVAAFTIDAAGILPRVRGLEEMITKAKQEYGSGVKVALQSPASGKRGLKRAVVAASGDETDGGLADLIHYYRWLLSNPSAQNDETAKKLGRLLYDSLVKPMEERLAGKKELLIVPDGVLALLPFETLIDGGGQYLVEKFDIRYAQSLSVLRLIEKRKFGGDRRPVLALGGAIYESPKVDELTGVSRRQKYLALGYGEWDPLPGTLAEVRGISGLVRGAEVITGAEVEESKLKAMSASGQLAKYRVLHFATHGLVVPEAPELSALVLSQFSEEKNGEDGYLDMAEIARLELRADFVALSACETGIGRIYGGEGVVGLAQAFLVAGANAMSVSLWQVPDASTAKLMQEVYRLVETKKMSYSAALNQAKRDFLGGKHGREWQSPHYWAPFIFFGGQS